MKNYRGYLKADFYRAFISLYFLAGIVGVCGSMILGTIENIGWNFSVLYVFHMVVYGLPFMLSTFFCSLPYSGCFCEDFEHKYNYISVARGSVKSYAASKILTICISSIVTLMLGVLLFICIAKMRLPWINISDSVYETTLASGGLRYFIKTKHYITYYLFFGIQFGLLTANLSLIASYISLFVSNKLVVLTIPTIAFYVITFCGSAIFNNNPKLDLYSIFNAITNVWMNDMGSFLYSILIGCLWAVISSKMIIRKLERRMKNE